MPDKNGGIHYHIPVAAMPWLIIPAMYFLLTSLGGGIETSSSSLAWFLVVPFWLVPLGFSLWAAFSLILNKSLASCCGNGRIAVAAALCAVPWAEFLICFIDPYSRSFVVVLLKHWFPDILLIGAAIWQAFGFIVLIRSKSYRWSLLVILCCLPCWLLILFFPLVAPGLYTILQGLQGNHL